jgi:hypothetical protein
MFKKAMEMLDKLGKSNKPEDELAALAKSLEKELGGDPLVKSEGEKEPDGDEDDDGKEPTDDKDDKGATPMAKSQVEQDDEALVLASEAYGALQKSVMEGTEATLGEMETIKKSLGALLNLSIKLAGVVGQLHEDRHENMERMAKSLETLAASPMIPNSARIGTGAVDQDLETGELKKSNSEVQDLLMKAISEKKVDPYHLSAFGTHKDINRLPAEVREIIGV